MLALSATSSRIISLLSLYAAYSKTNRDKPACPYLPICQPRRAPRTPHFLVSPFNCAKHFCLFRPFIKMTSAPFHIRRSRPSPRCVVAAHPGGCKLAAVSSALKQLPHHIVVPSRGRDVQRRDSAWSNRSDVKVATCCEQRLDNMGVVLRRSCVQHKVTVLRLPEVFTGCFINTSADRLVIAQSRLDEQLGGRVTYCCVFIFRPTISI